MENIYQVLIQSCSVYLKPTRLKLINLIQQRMKIRLDLLLIHLIKN